MPDYYYKPTGEYHFSGMWAILPMIPGIYTIYRLRKAHRQFRRLLPP